jgi:kumamolisin
MKRYTVYLTPRKAVLASNLHIVKRIIELGGKIVHAATKVTSLTFEVGSKIAKSALPNKDEILAIIDHDAGRNRYRRVKGQVKAQAQSLTPMQVAKAYNFPQVLEPLSGECVALVELGGSINPEYVNAYCTQMGLDKPTITIGLSDNAGEFSDGPDGADGEVDLDVCVVAGVAQGVQILVVFAPNTDQGFCDALQLAINHPLKPCAVSISWGSPEDYWTAPVRSVMDALIQQAQAQGMNVFVAAGDNGSSDGVNDGKPHVDYPAASPYAIACGGTKLILNTDNTIASEVTWQSDGATGGGYSALYNRPDYQSLPAACTTATAAAGNRRIVPDIAGDAAPDTGYIVNVDGDNMAIGGTSAVAPLYAAMTAVLTHQLGKSIGDLHTVLYNHPEVCNDITQGNNGAYKAGVGMDACTGLGSIDGAKLLAVLQGATVAAVTNEHPAKKFLKWLITPKKDVE